MATPQRIRLTSRTQFDHQLTHLLTEVDRAGDHWYLWQKLDAAIDEFGTEMHQTPIFWQLTLRAHQDITVLRLARLYDPTSGALSLGNVLRTIQHYVTYCRGKPIHLDVPGLDVKTLNAEIASVSDSDGTVSRLLQLRNRYLAHREAHIVGSGSFTSLPELARRDIDSLLGRASQIARKYNHLYLNRAVGPGLLGIDDYESLLRLLRSGLIAARAKRTRLRERPSKAR